MSSVDFSRENLTSLNRDGISEDLYKLLWARDEMNTSPQINLPDTIIYKYGQPVCWYFSSVNGHIKKKNKQNLISAKIEEAFSKYILGYDVIAYFITMPTEAEGKNENKPKSADSNYVIQYLDRDGLNNFLYNHKKEVNGILQRFIEPKSTHNELIRAVWSPKLCLLERAINIHELHDRRYGLYERCVVYEGPDYYYNSAPLRGPVLSGQLQKLCESTVAHISEVTYGQKQVNRFVLNFKVDSRDKIWLLFSTSIRCQDMLEYNPIESLDFQNTRRNLLNIDSVVSLSEAITLNPFKTYEKIIPKTKKYCLSCTRETVDDLRHPVTYKNIIKHFDHIMQVWKMSRASRPYPPKEGSIMWPPDSDIIEAAGSVGFGCLNFDDDILTSVKTAKKDIVTKPRPLKDLQIPPIIASLHPKLLPETYAKCKSDPLFVNKTVHLCEFCYLVYAEFQTMMLRMGENLTKLLTPDPQTVFTAPSTSDRPSSSDWRAISNSINASRSLSADPSMTAGSSMSRSAKKKLDEAKARSIGLRSNEVRSQPSFPSTIRSASDSHLIFNNQQPSMYSSIDETSAGSPFRGGLLDADSRLLESSIQTEEDIQAMIAERERRFFKEVSLNPQLKDQHPLMHIISAQQKLQLVDEQSGVLMKKSDAEAEGIFGQKYGRQQGDKYSKYNAYNTELPYAIGGEIILPSKLKLRKLQTLKEMKLKKQKSMKKFLSASGSEGDGLNPSATAPASFAQPQVQPDVLTNKTVPSQAFSAASLTTTKSKKSEIIDANVKSSKNYRDFLTDSLKKIQGDMSTALEKEKQNPTVSSPYKPPKSTNSESTPETTRSNQASKMLRQNTDASDFSVNSNKSHKIDSNDNKSIGSSSSSSPNKMNKEDKKKKPQASPAPKNKSNKTDAEAPKVATKKVEPPSPVPPSHSVQGENSYSSDLFNEESFSVQHSENGSMNGSINHDHDNNSIQSQDTAGFSVDTSLIQDVVPGAMLDQASIDKHIMENKELESSTIQEQADIIVREADLAYEKSLSSLEKGSSIISTEQIEKDVAQDLAHDFVEHVIEDAESEAEIIEDVAQELAHDLVSHVIEDAETDVVAVEETAQNFVSHVVHDAKEETEAVEMVAQDFVKHTIQDAETDVTMAEDVADHFVADIIRNVSSR